MPVSGWKGLVKITGTPTAMVGEATTELVADTVFQITNPIKRILDPDSAIVVKKNGVAQAAALYTLNQLFGTVTFLAAIGGADVVTLDANYLPTLEIIECFEASVQMTRDVADRTVFKGPASVDSSKQKFALLKEASGSISHLRALLDDLDPGGGTVKLFDVMGNGVRKVLELSLGDSGYAFRSWFLFESQELSAARDDLVNASLSWQSTSDDAGQSTFGIGLL